MALWRSLGRAAPAYSQRYHTQKQSISKGTPPNHGVPFRIADPAKTPLVTPSRSPAQKTHKPQVNSQSPITPKRYENVQTGDLDPRGIETQHIASRPVWRYASNSRRDPTAKRRNRSASTGVPLPPNAAIETYQPSTRYARTHACAGAKTGQTQRRVGTQFTNI